jgi:hypothetical protein
MSTRLTHIPNAVLPLLSLLYWNCDRLLYRVLTVVKLMRNAAELRSYQGPDLEEWSSIFALEIVGKQDWGRGCLDYGLLWANQWSSCAK